MVATGIFPTRLKISYLKKEIKRICQIIDLSPCSHLAKKIFDKIICGRLYHHINCNHILANEQFGFRNNLSTEIASCNLTL